MQITTLLVGELKACCYIVSSESGSAVVIDPGDEAGLILSAIKNLSVDVKYILLTHGHFDHISAAEEVRKQTGAKIAATSETADMTLDPVLNLAKEYAKASTSFSCDIVLADGDEIILDELTFKMISTPGHSLGGACFIVNNIIFSGDTVFRRSIGRTDFAGGSQAELMASLAKLARLEGDYTIYPGHGEETSLFWEREQNPFFRRAMRTV